MLGPVALSFTWNQLLPLITAVGAVADYVLPVFIIAYTIWWAYTLRKGSRIHRSTLALHIGVYGLAAGYVYLVSFLEIYAYGDRLEIVGVFWMLGALAITYSAVRAGMWYGGRTLQVIQSETGHWHLRGPMEIALFWAGLFGTRFALESIVLQGYSVMFPVYPLPSGVAVETFASVVVLVASLYLVSFGFLTGVSIAEWNLHTEMTRATEPVGSPPGPSSETR